MQWPETGDWMVGEAVNLYLKEYSSGKLIL